MPQYSVFNGFMNNIFGVTFAVLYVALVFFVWKLLSLSFNCVCTVIHYFYIKHIWNTFCMVGAKYENHNYAWCQRRLWINFPINMIRNYQLMIFNKDTHNIWYLSGQTITNTKEKASAMSPENQIWKKDLQETNFLKGKAALGRRPRTCCRCKFCLTICENEYCSSMIAVKEEVFDYLITIKKQYFLITTSISLAWLPKKSRNFSFQIILFENGMLVPWFIKY